MKIQDMIGVILKDARPVGTFTLPAMFGAASDGRITGLAVSREAGKLSCIAFISGEPEGAIYADEKGELYGDKAIMLIHDRDTFTLHEVGQDLVGAFVMGCRIFDNSHLKQGFTRAIPEFGKKGEGIGHLTLILRRSNEPQKGVRISLRKDGRIVGSDFTSGDGSAGFRVMYGNYDCIVQEKNRQILSFPLQFHEANPRITLDI